MQQPSPLWIFGYGSLIWRADFPYVERVPATINGYVRRFWQGSADHRGIPENPGRVATLHHSPESVCWGMAYRIDPALAEDVLKHLDYREKGGYDQLAIELLIDGNKRMGLTYFATPENPDYLGESALSEMVEQIMHAAGPSGTNIEYVLRLEEALLQFNQVDPHVSEIAEQLRNQLS
jgi:cation transport protein ChaC